MTREQFIADNPLEAVCQNLNIQLKGSGPQRMGKCPFHEDSTASFSANVNTKVWKCFAGCGGGSVIDLIMKAENLDYRHFAEKYDISKNGYHTNGHTVKSVFQTNQPDEKEIETIYPYQDHLGNEVFQVVRFKPKTFRPRHKVKDKWVYGLSGVQRVLYRLPEVLKAQTSWLCEGEKDVQSLVDLGYCATTSPGGANSWLDAYAEHLTGKDVVLCGDNDKAGKEYIDRVFESLAGKAATVRIVELPKSSKDVTEYIATFKDPRDAKKALDDLTSSAHPFIKGYKVSATAVNENESNYEMHSTKTTETSLSLGDWIPSLKVLRPMVPGELMFVVGATGSGKTAVLSSIALSCKLPTLFFELELPSELLFERLVASKTRITCREVEQAYRNGHGLGQESLKHLFPNLYLCTDSGLTVDDIEEQINRAELKIGVRPIVVYIDYIQLITGGSKDRYERISNIAERLKVMAKQLRVIIVASSQAHRPRDGEKVIGLHSGKESGSIENSCGVMLGIWRDDKDAQLLKVQVLKSTKDGGGRIIDCNFDGAKMLITERAHEPNT
jgi:5S rRNA maturation endonuclease (ribonuclease M5)